jgi:hypothetical protein
MAPSLAGSPSEQNAPATEASDALRRAEATVRRLYRVDFFWDINKALEFALLRTYAVPTIAALLDRTGETVGRPRKRYDDTVLIIIEVLDNGLDTDRARRAYARLDDMHGRYTIRNDDFLYVLSTFMLCPIDWLEKYGRRPMTADESEDWFRFWRAFGARMGIKDVFADLAAARDYREAFEATRYAVSRPSRKLSEASAGVVLADMHVPPILVPLGVKVVTALCEPRLVAALGYPEPSPMLRWCVDTGMALRRTMLRLLPPRTTPTPPQTGSRTYPEGYEIEELGTFARPRPATNEGLADRSEPP